MMTIIGAALEVLQLLWIFVVGSYLTLKRILFRSSPKSLKNEVILVTGGSSGIGQGILYRLAKLESNMTLISWDVNEASNEANMKKIRSLGVKRAMAMTVDVSSRNQVAAAAAKVRQEFGDVTMIFNNAGITGPLGKCWETDLNYALKTFDVNLFSHWYIMREFLPPMIRNNKGHIIPTCSVAGFVPGKNGAPYVGTKHAVHGYYNCLKEDLRDAHSSVNVSIVYPGHIHTNMTANVDLTSKAFPQLSTAISAQSAGHQIVDCVLYNDENIYVPSQARFLHMLSSWITPEMYRTASDLIDVNPVILSTNNNSHVVTDVK